MSFIDFLNRLLGDPNARELKRLRPLVPKVREMQRSTEIQSLTFADLAQRTRTLKERVADGMSLDELLPEAFALVLRACDLIAGKSVKLGTQTFGWNMFPFDVQILGGIVLHRGAITEMKTGEGKTLVCTMPVYLNALMGKGVHVVTVNDYLARRDAAWMGMLYKALGLTVGVVTHGLDTEERRAAYACDVTYGTNNEFGFDYLRDNMAPTLKSQVQRGLHYAIVDEVDSILVDEARTPLIISQPAEESTDKYLQYARLVGNLQENVHYNKDEKQRAVTLSEEGIKTMESLLGVDNIYTEKGFAEVHHIEQALRAHAIYQCDVDYVVKDGQIVIVDEFTGRLMPGRRYSHGLHQAIEAKEGVEVQRESKTLATITFQNYFRLYKKLAGMTGTAKTEEEEFESIYRLRVFVVPTHKSCVRNDKSDAVYRTVAAKFTAVANIAQEKHLSGQPVLIGTTSIEKSETLSALLGTRNIPHQVLNAKHHEQEAEIVAKAGQKGAVTIATNMAGRGTDIKLGEEVAGLGGLCILGTERHEARRIDNQLRGRSGRQGDQGESQFFVSMEDELMRLFGGERLKSMMIRLKVPDDVPLENGLVSRSIESAQKKVEGRNFDIRRHVLQYDDVMNKHREIIYVRRQKILEKIEEASHRSEVSREGDNPLHQDILRGLREEIASLVNIHAADRDPERWDFEEMHQVMATLHPNLGEIFPLSKLKGMNDRDELQRTMTHLITEFYAVKCRHYELDTVAQAERVVTLRTIDARWMDHIDDMAHLREQVAFAGYAQRDPLIEYQDQGFRRFQALLIAIESEIVRTLLQIDFAQFTPRTVLEGTEEEREHVQTNEEDIEDQLIHTAADLYENAVHAKKKVHSLSPTPRPIPARTVGPGGRTGSFGQSALSSKVGRNDPCPCGSGKKYKKCHGK